MSTNDEWYQSLTYEHKRGLVSIIHWYWTLIYNEEVPPISQSDYDFIYDIWKSGIDVYNIKTKDRLNKIRDIYIKNKSDGNL